MRTKQETIEFCEEKIRWCEERYSAALDKTTAIKAYQSVIDFLKEEDETTETTLVG